jgi:hypothetical protein
MATYVCVGHVAPVHNGISAHGSVIRADGSHKWIQTWYSR